MLGQRDHSWLLLITLAVATGIVFLIPSQVANAHAFLVRTTPRAGEHLESSPQSVDFQFSEPVVGGEQVTVTTADGSPIEVGPVQRLRDGSSMRVDLPQLEDGIYVVSWQVLAADGHLSVGEFAFAVGTTAKITVTASQNSGTIAWFDAAASWVWLIGLLLAFGGLASERFVWRPVARRHEVAILASPVGWLLVIAVLGGILQLLLVAEQAGAGGALPTNWSGWMDILGTRPGLLTAAQLALATYGLWVLRFQSLRLWAMLPLSLALVATAVRGHAGTTEQWWAAPVNVIHLAAVGFWVGALGHLLLMVWRLRGEERGSVLAEGVRRYATLALWLVGLVLVSGVIVALSQFKQLEDVFTTRYGQVLLLKLLAVTATLGLAYAARRFALPARFGIRIGRLRRLTRAEAVFILTSIVVAAVLANTAPPRSVEATATNLLGPPPLEGPVLRQATLAGSLAVYLAAGEDQLRVQVLAPSGDPASSVQIEEVQGRAPDGTTFDVAPRACGPGCMTTAFPWQAGTTTLSMLITAETWDGGEAQFSVSWPPQPEDPALLERVIASMRSQTQFTVTEHVSSGPGLSSERTFQLTGEQFLELELYVTGGADDIRSVPAPEGRRALTLYLPGSSIWYYLEIDDTYRLRRQVIVSPGHLIKRTFEYGVSNISPSPAQSMVVNRIT